MGENGDYSRQGRGSFRIDAAYPPAGDRRGYDMAVQGALPLGDVVEKKGLPFYMRYGVKVFHENAV
jgi:hypothetical protein